MIIDPKIKKLTLKKFQQISKQLVITLAKCMYGFGHMNDMYADYGVRFGAVL